MPKIRLSLDILPEYFLLGISSHQKDYRLAWQLNQSLHCDFERINSDKKELDPLLSETVLFNHNVNEQYNYYLLSNQTDQGLFAPDFKHAHYFFIISGMHELLPLDDIISKINRTIGVLTSFRIDPCSSKTFTKLISI